MVGQNGMWILQAIYLRLLVSKTDPRDVMRPVRTWHKPIRESPPCKFISLLIIHSFCPVL